MHLPVLWLMLALLTRSIASVELTCSTNTTANGTFYKVPDFGKSHCTPQWLDADNNTFAIGDKKNGSLVVASNITTLLTYDCYNIVMYILDCYPQTWRNKKFTCVANCSKSARVTPDNKEGTVNHWVVPVTCCIFICAVGVICYCRRQRPTQNGS